MFSDEDFDCGFTRTERMKLHCRREPLAALAAQLDVLYDDGDFVSNDRGGPVADSVTIREAAGLAKVNTITTELFLGIGRNCADPDASRFLLRHGTSELNSIRGVHCARGNGVLTDVGIREIFDALPPTIMYLHLFDCAAATADTLRYVLADRTGASLVSLVLADCSDVRDRADALSPAIAAACPNLVHIDLTGSNVGERGLRALMRGCGRLASLCLQRCPAVSDDAIIAIGGGLKHKLRAIALAQCTTSSSAKPSTITSRAMVYLATQCTELLRLDLASRHVTAGALSVIARSCPSLMHLSLACPEVTDLTPVSSLTSVTDVTLLDMPHLTATCLRCVAQGCRRLRNAAFGSAPLADDTVLEALANSSPHLEKFSLENSALVTSATMCKLVKAHAAWLTELNVSGCAHAVDDALFTALGGLASDGQLRLLHVANCNGFSKGAFSRLVSHCRGLTSVDVHGTSQLTDGAILQLSGHNPQMTMLDVSYTAGAIGQDAISRIVLQCTTLRHIKLGPGEGTVSDYGLAGIVQTAAPCLHTVTIVAPVPRLSDHGVGIANRLNSQLRVELV